MRLITYHIFDVFLDIYITTHTQKSNEAMELENWMANYEILSVISLHFCFILSQSRLMNLIHTHIFVLYLVYTAVHVFSDVCAFIIFTYLTLAIGEKWAEWFYVRIWIAWICVFLEAEDFSYIMIHITAQQHLYNAGCPQVQLEYTERCTCSEPPSVLM